MYSYYLSGLGFGRRKEGNQATNQRTKNPATTGERAARTYYSHATRIHQTATWPDSKNAMYFLILLTVSLSIPETTTKRAYLAHKSAIT